MNNYELLGCPANESISDNLHFLENKAIPEDIQDVRSNPWAFTYHIALHTLYCCITHQHLGAKSSKPTGETLQVASRLTYDYFSKDWKKDGSDEPVEIKKEPGNEDLAWFEMLRRGLLMASLAGDQKTLGVLRDWMENWLVPEYADPPTDPLLGKVFISIAAAFRKKPLDGLEDMEAAIRKSRKQGPKLLFQAWEAARRHDQAAFEDALLQSVVHFEKTMRKPMNPEDAIAFDQSTVLAASRHFGMNLPKYEPRVLARLVSHESLGIPAPKKSR